MAMNESTFDIQAQLIGNSMDSGSLSSYQQIKIKSEVIAINSDKLANGSHNTVANQGQANGFGDFAHHFRGVDPNLLGDGTRDLDEIEEEDDYIPIESAIEPMKVDPPKEEPQPEPQPAAVKEPEPETKVEEITTVSVQSPQPKPEPEVHASPTVSPKKHLELEPTVVVPIVEVHYTSKDPVSERLEFCLVCGSTGDSSNLIYCHDCGESYHTFCLTPKVVVENLNSLAEWRCPHCKFCEQCLEMSEEDKLIMCDKCDRCFHIFCLDPPLQQVPNESWRCSHCIKCDRCGTRTPGEGPEAKWTHSYTLCWTCGQEYDKKLAEIKQDLVEQSKNKPVPPPITTVLKISKQEPEPAPVQEPAKQAPIAKSEEKTEVVDIVTPQPGMTVVASSIKEEPQYEKQNDASPDDDDDHDIDVDSDPPPSYNSDGDDNLLPEDEEEMKEDFEVMSDDKMDIEETSLSGIEDYDMSEEDKTKRSNGAYSFKDAAFMVLKKAGKPLSVNKITEICIKEGYITTEGKTPERTMGSNLYCEINKYGDKARFKKLGKGIFTVSPYAEKHLLNRRSVKKKKEASPMKPQSLPSNVHPTTRSSRRQLTSSTNGEKPERPVSPAPTAAPPPVVEKKPIVTQETAREVAPTAPATKEVSAASVATPQQEAHAQAQATRTESSEYFDREKHAMEEDFVDISEESSDRSMPINIPNGYSNTTMYNGHSTADYPTNGSVRLFDDEANHNQVAAYHAHRQSMHHDEDDLFGHKQAMPMRTMDTFSSFEMHDMYSGATDMHDYLSHRPNDADTSLLMYPTTGYTAGFHNQAPEAYSQKYSMPYESHVANVPSTSVYNHKSDMMSNFGMNRTSDLTHMDFFDSGSAFASRPIIQQVARQTAFSNSPKLGPSHIGFEHMPNSPHHSSPPDSVLKPTGFSDPGFYKNTNSPSLNPIDPFAPKSPFHSPESTPGVISPMHQSPPTQLPMLNSYQNGQTQILSPTPTKRGRGRPRKYPPSETPTPPPPEGDTPKRGRGRPPKNRSGTPQPGTSQTPPPQSVTPQAGTPVPPPPPPIIPSASPSPLLESDLSPVPLIQDEISNSANELLLSLTMPTTLVDVTNLGPPEMSMSNATLETLQAKRGRGRPRKYPIGEPRPPRPSSERNKAEPTEPRRIVTRPRKIPKSEDFIFEYQPAEHAVHEDDKMTASSVDEDPEFKGPRPLAVSSNSAASEGSMLKRGRGRPPKLRDSFGTPILSRSASGLDGSTKRPVGRPKKALHYFGGGKLIRGTADFFNSAEINENTPLTLNTISRLENGPALNKVWNYKKTLDLSENTPVVEPKAQKDDIEVNCLNIATLDKRVHPHTKDTRKCALCKEEGDLAVRGRLLFLTMYTWVHSNCASWSSEVFESEEGDLINIWKALHRAKTTVCDLCRGVGATVSCNSVRCSKNYHFNCAIKANCKFSTSPEDKFVNCEAHAPASIVKSEAKDPANPNRIIHCVMKSSFTQNKKLVPQKVNLAGKKSKLTPQTPPQDLLARVGALSVRNLGQIVHDKKAFSSADYIFPLHYTSSRIYWSWKIDRDDDVIRRRNIRVGRKLRKKPQHRDMIRLPKLFLPRCLYRMQIFEIDGEPCFKITCEDDPDVLIVGKTAADAWRQVIEKINSAIFNLYKELLSNIELYKKMDVEPLSRLLLIRNNLRSEYFFGLGSPTVIKMIEKLPNARLCRAYNFQYDMIIRIPRTILHSVLYNREIKTELPVNPSGCARTEPYSKKNNDEKMEYMGAYGFQALHNKLVPSLAGRKINNSREDHKHADTIKELPVGVLYRQMRQKLNKTIQVMRSPIHEWGVFAKQEIKENDMIIEYVGEEIRQKMADLREIRYNSKGIGCYMFKIDEDIIVDATEKGNIARFINHCCDPNAVTRIVTVEGRKKIIIFAKKDIKPGEEIAYDYMFPIEDEKVPCRCGAASCRGTMN